MNEAEWLSTTDPEELLDALRASGKASERKCRLLACACVRAAWPLTGEAEHPVVVTAERFADSQATEGDLLRARNGLWSPRTHWIRSNAGTAATVRAAANATCSPSAWSAALNAAKASAQIQMASWRENPAQCELVRDIFGRLPFRPLRSLPASVVAWRGRLVVNLARATYDNRLLPTGHLDPTRLAVLGDALEDAGCEGAEILGHLRGPGPHVRGCYIMDLILGKE
jgi:hypothetical protein